MTSVISRCLLTICTSLLKSMMMSIILLHIIKHEVLHVLNHFLVYFLLIYYIVWIQQSIIPNEPMSNISGDIEFTLCLMCTIIKNIDSYLNIRCILRYWTTFLFKFFDVHIYMGTSVFWLKLMHLFFLKSVLLVNLILDRDNVQLSTSP